MRSRTWNVLAGRDLDCAWVKTMIWLAATIPEISQPPLRSNRPYPNSLSLTVRVENSNTHSINWPLQLFLSVQFNSIKYTHIICAAITDHLTLEPSHLARCKTPCPFNPVPGNQHSTFSLMSFTVLGTFSVPHEQISATVTSPCLTFCPGMTPQEGPEQMPAPWSWTLQPPAPYNFHSSEIIQPQVFCNSS